MEATTDDNFFIEEPQNLRNNFFNRDKSMQIIELLAQKHHHPHKNAQQHLNHEPHLTPKNKEAQQFHPFSISFMMKKPEFKNNSAEHITKLLQNVQHTLDYRDNKSIDCLSAVLDDHFVELVKTDEYVDVIEHLSAYIDSQSALLKEVENTKCLLKPIMDLLGENGIKKLKTMGTKNKRSTSCQIQEEQRKRIYHTVDFIKF